MKTIDVRRLVMPLLAAGLLGGGLAAAEPVIVIWPEGVPGFRADASPEKVRD